MDKPSFAFSGIRSRPWFSWVSRDRRRTVAGIWAAMGGCALVLPLPAPADQHPATEEHAREVAKQVENQAERTEKAEGRNDRAKDSVRVKPDGDQPVIEQTGEASFYGEGFQGKETASGEPFDAKDKTAAHPTLPLGSKARVTHMENGKSVDVEINDRGPYAKGRDIDLSKKAATSIGLDADGTAPVKIEATLPPEGKERAHP